MRCFKRKITITIETLTEDNKLIETKTFYTEEKESCIDWLKQN